MKNRVKHILSVVLAVCVAAMMLPTGAFALETMPEQLPVDFGVVEEAPATEEVTIVEIAPDDSVTVDTITDVPEDTDKILIEETFDADPNYLTFTAEEDNSSVTFNYRFAPDVKVKIGSEDWTAYTKGTEISLASIGDTVSFKGTDVTTNDDNHFSMTGKIAASGDVTSLTNENGGDATLTFKCYTNMFLDCASLTSAPALPAKTLAEQCYLGMFRGCTGLTTAPALPATTLAVKCYSDMFDGCTGLTVAPELLVTELADGCYSDMFAGCTGLTTAPALPATTLKPECYSSMFFSCKGLTAPPALPATTLAVKCYYQMFQDCIGIKVSDTQTVAYTKAWRIPTTGNATEADWWNGGMLTATGGTFTGNPTLNTTYYLYAPDLSNALTFTAEAVNSSVTLNYNSGSDVKVKIGSADWTAYTKGTEISLANVNDTVSFIGAGVTTDESQHFTMTGKVAASGDVTSLTNGIGGDVVFRFEDEACYSCMFKDCTALTAAPALPATTLIRGCYGSMFQGCTSLTTAPALSATTLATNCYNGMFQGCTGLTVAPELSVTTLQDGCYSGMFKGCTGLTAAPELSATTLQYDCYNSMFDGCTGLTTPPALPATTLKNSCYRDMFKGCTGIKVSETKTGAYTKEWRIPTTGTATPASTWNEGMLLGTTGIFTGNPAVNTIYYLYEDKTPPVITGIENGKTYCITAEFTVTDADLATVTANGTALTAVDGKYKLTEVGTYNVVATDVTGNSTTISVTLNATHTLEITWSSDDTNHWHVCSVCGEKKDTAAHTYDDACDTTCNVCGATRTAPHDWKITWSSDGTNHWHECALCGEKKDTAAHTYTDACDTTCNVCGATRTVAHNWKAEWSSDGTNHWHECALCGEKKDTAAHTYDDACDTTCNVCGATRTAPHDWKTTWSSDGTNHWHECALCGEKKDTSAHTWDDGVVTKEPTTTEKGVKTYTCTVCGATKTEEIAKLAPIIIEGNNGSYQQGANGGLTFKSNAAFADFISVSVDGNVIDKANYTLKEGSTIATLTDAYLATLSVGKHTLSINSASGTASTEFTITAKATNPTNPTNQTNPLNPTDNPTPSVSTIPQTADTTPVGLLMSLMTASIIGVGGIYAIRRKNRK